MPRFASPLLVPVLHYFTLPVRPQEIKIQKPKGMIFHLLEFLMFFNGLANTEKVYATQFGYLLVTRV